MGSGEHSLIHWGPCGGTPAPGAAPWAAVTVIASDTANAPAAAVAKIPVPRSRLSPAIEIHPLVVTFRPCRTPLPGVRIGHTVATFPKGRLVSIKYGGKVARPIQ